LAKFLELVLFVLELTLNCFCLCLIIRGFYLTMGGFCKISRMYVSFILMILCFLSGYDREPNPKSVVSIYFSLVAWFSMTITSTQLF